MLVTFSVLISILFILLAIPFALVKITNDENRKTPRNLSGIAFYRKHPKLLEFRRKISKIDVSKWHSRFIVFCIILAALTIAFAGYYPEETRVSTVFRSFITLGGACLISYSLLSLKRGHTDFILSEMVDTVYRHKEPVHFWFVTALQFFLGIICLFTTQV